MGCCFSDEESVDHAQDERRPLLEESNRATPGQPIPNAVTSSGSHLNKSDEESALNQILQRTANDVIDITYGEPHSLERSEHVGRSREYQSKMASLRRVKNNSALPNSDQNPQISLSRDLPSSADLKFMEDRSEAANSAVSGMEVKHGEPLVVQFATP